MFNNGLNFGALAVCQNSKKNVKRGRFEGAQIFKRLFEGLRHVFDARYL